MSAPGYARTASFVVVLPSPLFAYQHAVSILRRGRSGRRHTGFVCGDIFPCKCVLLVHLVLHVLLALVQHLELPAQAQDRLLWRILLGLAAAKPAKTPARHDYGSSEGHRSV